MKKLMVLGGFYGLFVTTALFMLCLGCKQKKEEINTAFETPREYKYQEYATEEECRTHHPNVFYACVQRIAFGPDGRTEAILEESDILLAGNYVISNNSIEAYFDLERGKYTLGFEIISDSTIRRVGTEAVWVRFK